MDTSPEQSFVQIDTAQASDLNEALTSISDQAHITFIVEGHLDVNPLYTEQASKLSSIRMPIPTLVAKLASCYDYKAEQKENVYILYKYYKITEQLPFASTQETSLCLRNINNIVSKFSTLYIDRDEEKKPAVKRISPVSELMQTLSAAQLANLHDGKLTYQSLAPKQKNIVMRLIVNIYLSSRISQLKPSVDLISTINEKEFCVKQVSLFPNHSIAMFGYENAISSVGKKQFVELCPFTPQIAVSKNKLSLDKIQNQSSMVSQNSDTIATLVSQYNISAHHYASVEPYAANNPITVVGKKYSSSDEVLKAAAKIYGLGFFIDSTGNSQLLRETMALPLKLSDVSSAIDRAIPASLSRAMHLEEYNDLANVGTERVLSIEDNKKLSELIRYPEKLKNDALKKLLLSVRERLTKSPGEAVPFKSLTEEEKSAFGIYVFSSCIEDLQTLTNPHAPAYVSDIDKLSLKGNVGVSEDGRKYSNISFILTNNATNRVEDLAGYTHFDVP